MLKSANKENEILIDELHTDVPAGLSKTTWDSVTAMILEFQSMS